MQILHRHQILAIPPLWRLGFRPFFLAGSALALLAIPLWIAALLGLFADWQPTGGWLAWHRHEMVFGFVVAIIASCVRARIQRSRTFLLLPDCVPFAPYNVKDIQQVKLANGSGILVSSNNDRLRIFSKRK